MTPPNDPTIPHDSLYGLIAAYLPMKSAGPRSRILTLSRNAEKPPISAAVTGTGTLRARAECSYVLAGYGLGTARADKTC